MKKLQRLAQQSVEYLYRCLICRHETTRVYKASETPPTNITCPACYCQARLQKN